MPAPMPHNDTTARTSTALPRRNSLLLWLPLPVSIPTALLRRLSRSRWRGALTGLGLVVLAAGSARGVTPRQRPQATGASRSAVARSTGASCASRGPLCTFCSARAVILSSTSSPSSLSLSLFPPAVARRLHSPRRGGGCLSRVPSAR